MMIKATCKVCRRALEVECDDRYLKLGDPQNLIPMLTCNDCYDRRELRSKATEAIVRLCGWLASMDLESRRSDKLRSKVKQVAQAYCRMIAAWHHASGMVWDDTIVEALIEQPRDLSGILNRCWRMFRDRQASPELL